MTARALPMLKDTLDDVLAPVDQDEPGAGALGHTGLGRPATRAEEARADRLAAMLVAPPSRVREALTGTMPDPAQVLKLSSTFDISIEAAARAYAELHPEPVAVLIVRDGRVAACFRDRHGFPFVRTAIGDPPAVGSLASGGAGPPSRVAAVPTGGDWLVRPPAGSSLLEHVLEHASGALIVVLQLIPASVPSDARPA